MNTHLESLKKCRTARIDQLKYVFRRAIFAAEERHIIFGGDLNIRENEVRVLTFHLYNNYILMDFDNAVVADSK